MRYCALVARFVQRGDVSDGNVYYKSFINYILGVVKVYFATAKIFSYI